MSDVKMTVLSEPFAGLVGERGHHTKVSAKTWLLCSVAGSSPASVLVCFPSQSLWPPLIFCDPANIFL
jgi:hypothetical protein